jgi:3-deoxy-manno-octulosonate cytidylyltransferase (CMP-KDO synthetase)
VLIATDAPQIVEAAESFGARAVLTSSECRSGTDRVAEAAENVEADCIVNVQGDEPELDPNAVADLLAAMEKNPDVPMGTLAVCCASAQGLGDPAVVKVVVGRDMRALYFSRALVPHDRDAAGAAQYWRHVGVYAYRKEYLRTFVGYPAGRLEEAEKLEQLRALENGDAILVTEAVHAGAGIDTPEDYAAFVERCRKN